MPPSLDDIFGKTPQTSYDVLPDIQHEVADTTIGDVADTTTPIVNESDRNESINDSINVDTDISHLHAEYKKAYKEKYNQPYLENNTHKDLVQLQALCKRFSHESSWGGLSAGKVEHIRKVITAYFEHVKSAKTLGITGLVIHASRLHELLKRHRELHADRSA